MTTPSTSFPAAHWAGGDAPHIVVTRPLPGPAIDTLRAAGRLTLNPDERTLGRDELLALLPDADALLCLLTDTIDAAILDAAPHVRIVADYAVGYNNIDVQAATARGIMVSNTPGVLTETTADFTWALLLAVCRRLVEGDAIMRRHAFSGWGPSYMLGSDVFGKTLGIVGMGRIGQAVARRARGFRMPVLYCHRPGGSTYLPTQLEQEIHARSVSFNELLAEADIVSLHVPYNPVTHHLIDAAALHQMKRSAYVINTARGPIVDEAALIEALRTGAIAGAGLDVFEREPDTLPGLTDLPNVVLAPHLGSATIETRTLMATTAARNVLATLAGERPPNLVNPEVWDRRRGQ